MSGKNNFSPISHYYADKTGSHAKSIGLQSLFHASSHSHRNLLHTLTHCISTGYIHTSSSMLPCTRVHRVHHRVETLLGYTGTHAIETSLNFVIAREVASKGVPGAFDSFIHTDWLFSAITFWD